MKCCYPRLWALCSASLGVALLVVDLLPAQTGWGLVVSRPLHIVSAVLGLVLPGLVALVAPGAMRWYVPPVVVYSFGRSALLFSAGDPFLVGAVQWAAYGVMSFGVVYERLSRA